jgi:hypothetical protein
MITGQLHQDLGDETATFVLTAEQGQVTELVELVTELASRENIQVDGTITTQPPVLDPAT